MHKFILGVTVHPRFTPACATYNRNGVYRVARQRAAEQLKVRLGTHTLYRERSLIGNRDQVPLIIHAQERVYNLHA